MPGRRAGCDEHDPFLPMLSYGVSYRSVVPLTGLTPSPASTTKPWRLMGPRLAVSMSGAGLQPAVPMRMEGMKGRSQDVECDLSPKRAPTVGLVQSGISLP